MDVVIALVTYGYEGLTNRETSELERSLCLWWRRKKQEWGEGLGWKFVKGIRSDRGRSTRLGKS